MMKIRALLALLLTIPTAAVFAANQVISFKGQWHVDLQRSAIPQSADTKSVHLDVITDDGKIYEAAETVVRSNGETTTQRVRLPLDRKFHRIEGSPNAVSASITRRVSGAMTIELRGAGGIHGREVCEISTDRNTITCGLTGTDPQGRTTSAKSVYVRDYCARAGGARCKPGATVLAQQPSLRGARR